MNCKDTHKHITDYLEGILGESKRSEMESHLATCSMCSERVAFFRSGFDVIEIDKRVEADAEFTSSVMSKIQSTGKVISLRTRLLYVASVAAIVLVAVFSGSFLARLSISGHDTEVTSLFVEDMNFEPVESFFLLKDKE